MLEFEGGTAISLLCSLFLVFFLPARLPTPGPCLTALLFSVASSFGAGLSFAALGLFVFRCLWPGALGALTDCWSMGGASLDVAGAFESGVLGPFWLTF